MARRASATRSNVTGKTRHSKTARTSASGDGERAKPLRAPRKAKESRPKVLQPDRGRQVVRLLTILRALGNARQGLSAQQLRELLDASCSLRTVYRDVDHLQQAGFAISQEGARWHLERGGASAGAEGFGVPLQPWELLSILLTQDLVAPLEGTALADSLRDLRGRLASHLTPEGREWLDQLRQHVRATLEAPILAGEHAAVLDPAEEAIAKEECLSIEYRAPGRKAERRIVEPHLLWYHAGRAYLVAYCRSRQAFRTFAIQRISEATVLEETFERRAELDGEAFTKLGFGVLHGEVHDVVVELAEEVAHLATERVWHHTQRVETMEDGRARLRFRAAGLPEIASWVASFGGKMRVIRPRELVDAVVELHRAGLATYEGVEASSDVGRAKSAPRRVGKASRAGTLRGVDLG